MELDSSKIYFYINSNNNGLSLIIHHHKENGTSGIYQAIDFNFSGIPESAYVALSDDHPPYQDIIEFNISEEPEGNWYFRPNSDGRVLSGLPTDSQ